MATFYLLPPRALLGNRLATVLGLPIEASNCDLALWMEAVESIGRAVETTGAFVVYRDDLPPGEDPAHALADGFGAENGDEVVELESGAAPRRWHVSCSLARSASEGTLARASG